MFQAGIIKLCNKDACNFEKIEERVEKLEKYIKEGKVVSNVAMPTYVEPKVVLNNTPRQENTQTKTKPQKPQATTKKFSDKSEEYWPQIVNDLKQSGKIVLYTNLMNTKAVEINDMTVGIEFPNGLTSFGKTVLEKQDNIREISNLVSMACGKEMQIKYIVPEQKNLHKVTNEENLQNFAKESGISFNVID